MVVGEERGGGGVLGVYYFCPCQCWSFGQKLNFSYRKETKLKTLPPEFKV